MTDLADANARSRISAEFGTTFFVEAAAGTGKTTALVGRIVGLIRSGRGTLARTVAVTFTETTAWLFPPACSSMDLVLPGLAPVVCGARWGLLMEPGWFG
jgi:UvrD/REP helicase N-terminal domain